MRKLLTALVMVPALALAAPAMAAHDGHGKKDKEHCGEKHKHKHKKGHHGAGFLKGLDLTDDQKAEIKELRKTFHTEQREQMKAQWQLRKELAQLSYQTEVDQAKLDTAIENASEAFAEQLEKRAALNSAIFNVLTPEQQQQAQQKWAEHSERRAKKSAD